MVTAPAPSKFGLPFAVYGTLRPYERNAAIWRDVGLYVGSGFVRQYRMLQIDAGGFPFVEPSNSDDDVVVVDLIRPVFPALYDELLVRLDSLESEGSLYKREVVPVFERRHDQHPWLHAWLYVGLNEFLWEGATAIPSGDWFDRPEPRLIRLNRR